MLVLKNGTVVDGTGKPGYQADVLVERDKIISVSRKKQDYNCETIDCCNKIVAPGFIDMHSHNDWFIGSSNAEYFIEPFIRQGITTFIAGNCGFGIAGFKKGTEFKGLLEQGLFKEGLSDGFQWNSYAELFNYLNNKGIDANLFALSGSGTVRTSISGFDSEPLKDKNLKLYLQLIEKSLEEGTGGLSFGMGYAPDIFLTFEEMKKAAEIVKKHEGFISVHARAFSKVSGAYPIIPFSAPHNIKALKEFINLSRETGVALQLSHLIFVGENTWPTVDKALKLIDDARSDGVDVEFDTYFHQCGATVITGILPDWFMAQVPNAYSNKKMLKKLKRLLNISFQLLGFNYSDIRLAAANAEGLDRYNGLYLSEIAKDRGMENFENYIDIASKSNSSARLLIDKYSCPAVISTLMQHPSAHFMTDAWMEPAGLQNPAVYGCFPGFIRKALDESVIPIEECVRKMTGANADRAGIKGRGYIQEGAYADITVFNPITISDSSEKQKKEETGIDFVLINGEMKCHKGVINTSEKSGRILVKK